MGTLTPDASISTMNLRDTEAERFGLIPALVQPQL